MMVHHNHIIESHSGKISKIKENEKITIKYVSITLLKLGWNIMNLYAHRVMLLDKEVCSPFDIVCLVVPWITYVPHLLLYFILCFKFYYP